MSDRSLGHRAPLFWAWVPFAAGLASAKAGCPSGAPGGWLAAAVVAAAGGCLFAWKGDLAQPRTRAAALAILTTALFLAGLGRYQVERRRLGEWETLPPREARVVLEIERLFPSDDPRQVRGLARLREAESHLHDLLGQRLYFSLRSSTGKAPPAAPREFTRTGRLAVVGLLQRLPLDPPAQSFDGFLAAGGVNFTLTRGAVREVVSPPTAFARFCQRAQRHFEQLLRHGIGEHAALASIYSSMLLGTKADLTDEQETLFIQSGTMHLLAISGLHIGVIALAVQSALSLLRVPRRVALLATLGVVWLYVEITGASPSAQRAWLMIAFVFAAQLFRQPANPLAALAASGCAVLAFEPLQLFSASFQMSYAVVAALLLLALPMAETWQERWPAFPHLPEPSWTAWHRLIDAGRRALFLSVAISVAATLVSAVTGAVFFQLVAPGGFFANLLLVPLSSLALAAGLASLACGLLGLLGPAALFNHAALVAIWVMDAAVRASEWVPGWFLPATLRAPWLGPLALIGLLALLFVGYACRWRKTLGGFWTPIAAAVAFVLLATQR